MLYRRVFQIVTSTIVGLSLIYSGFALFTARSAVSPWWYAREAPVKEYPTCNDYMRKVYVYCYDPKQSLNLDFQDFSIETEGVKGHAYGPIRTTGWAVAADPRVVLRGTVVLVHGGGADRRAMLKHARYLHEGGYHVLLIDCHNHGFSGRDGRGISFGLWESQSVVDAALWAKKHLAGALDSPVFALGTSQGAFAALKAMADSPVIKGVVADSTYLSVKSLLREFPALSWEPRAVKEGAIAILGFWLGRSLAELDVRSFAESFGRRPVLIVHGLEDEVVPRDQAEEAFDAIKGPKEIFLVREGRHEYLWNVDKQGYELRVLTFLEKATKAAKAESSAEAAASVTPLSGH